MPSDSPNRGAVSLVEGTADLGGQARRWGWYRFMRRSKIASDVAGSRTRALSAWSNSQGATIRCSPVLPLLVACPMSRGRSFGSPSSRRTGDFPLDVLPVPSTPRDLHGHVHRWGGA